MTEPLHALSAPTHASLTPAVLVDGEERLSELLGKLGGRTAEPLAIDTEANSFHRYFEKVCLFQLGVDGRAFVVDPLAVDLAPLLAALATRPLLLHGADYDLRLLHRGYGFRAFRVFDTMLAAQLLGEKELGLAALLGKRVGVTLDKTNQRADWSARPLVPELIDYAAADVLHLPALVASLTADLEAKGRLAWHEEECARLAESPFPQREVDFEEDWRLKGTNALTSRERAFVRALWQAREHRSRETDRPPFRVLTNERLLDAARRAAVGESDLAKLFPGPRPLPPAFARLVRSALDATRGLPPDEWPPARRPERSEANPALERLVDALKKRRDAAATALGLDPGVLASRATLTAAARAALGGRRLSATQLAEETGMSTWRAALLAD